MLHHLFALLSVWLLLCGRSMAIEAVGTITRVDADQGIVVVHAGGRERTLTTDKELKVFDKQGEVIASGLKSPELKQGAQVTVTVERVGGQPVLQAIRLGANTANRPGQRPATRRDERTSVGLKPLDEMTAADRYKGENGGLYGEGRNAPPPEHQAAAVQATAQIVPLDRDGQPSPAGKIVMVSISMSNATQEFSQFKRLADADAEKSSQLTIVDCAQGGQAMAQWATPDARPWSEAERRLAAAGVAPEQVQVAWVKLANVRPTGELNEHGKKLYDDTLAVLQVAKSKFPNLRIAYLGSRIYAGYAGTNLNPEPYAYEGAFVVRWLLRDQMKGNAELNFDPTRSTVKAPLLLWGPYLWADGTTPRKSDGLVWKPDDLASDGTHPSDSGRRKVAELLLTFFKSDALARQWFSDK
jgi:hypothetical protein